MRRRSPDGVKGIDTSSRSLICAYKGGRNRKSEGGRKGGRKKESKGRRMGDKSADRREGEGRRKRKKGLERLGD